MIKRIWDIILVIWLILLIIFILFIVLFKNKNENNWYTNNKLIGHALYGIDNNDYTNSYEALIEGYSEGIRVMEVDFLLTSDK